MTTAILLLAFAAKCPCDPCQCGLACPCDAVVFAGCKDGVCSTHKAARSTHSVDSSHKVHQHRQRGFRPLRFVRRFRGGCCR